MSNPTHEQQDATLLALSSLKRQGLVVQHADRWEVTTDGHMAARQLMTGSPLPKPAAEPIPMESGYKKPRKARATLRQAIGGAPRPVTRTDTPPTVRNPRTVAEAEAPGVTGNRSGQPLPAITYPARAERLGPPMFADLLERCAAMHLVLLAQAKEARKAGDPNADRELAWLIETGEQLLQAGGAHG